MSDEQMAVLWERMAEIYGALWRQAYGSPTAILTWQKGLADLSGEQIAAGLKRCLAREEPWPPTLPEFRALCKPYVAPYHRPLKLIGKPSDPQKAKAAIQRAKEILQ